MFCTDSTVLVHNEVSCSTSLCLMLRAGSTGTDVNSAITSHEQRHSPGWRVTLLALSTKSVVLWTWCCDFPTKGLSILAWTLATP